MKKLLCLLLACLMLVACFTACGGDNETKEPASSDADSATTGSDTASGDNATGDSDTGSADASTSSASGTAFKLGGTGPLSGGAAIYGNAAMHGAEIAVEEINAMGGIQFELRYEDDTHVAETAVNAYNVLKEWGMQISLGSVTSTPGLSTSVKNFEDRIFALTPSASAPAVIEGKDNVFQMCFTDDNQGMASAQYIAEQGLGENIFIQVDELAAEPFILLEEGRGGGCIRELLARHPQINVQYRVADDYTILNMVESRLGVSILPEAVLRRSGQRLTARRLSPELQRTIGVIYKQKTGLSTAGQLFLSELKASRIPPRG